MKRDVRLRGLSSDHHHALVLARTLVKRVSAGQPGAAIAEELKVRFASELAPHFAIEEEILLPALRSAGEGALAQRTLDEHAALRAAAAAIERGDYARITTFAALLMEHVRFEERELLPCCEARLGSEALDEASRRTAAQLRTTPQSAPSR